MRGGRGTVADTFEGTLAAAERALDSALKAATAATRELRRARVGAKNGQVRDLRKALQSAQVATVGLAEEVRAAHEGFKFDENEYLASGAYTKELLAAAAAAGVAMYEEDERLLCYPALLRVLPGDAVVDVDRVRERRLRPSVLVGLLAAAQERAPRFKPEAFLDSLRGGYELVVARDGKTADGVVRLVDVWAVLTMLPGQAREYTKQEFARDLYLLGPARCPSRRWWAHDDVGVPRLRRQGVPRQLCGARGISGQATGHRVGHCRPGTRQRPVRHR